MTATDNRCLIAGVPCLVLAPQGAPIGRVVLVHGWGSTQDSYRFFASLLAGWGYRVIVPELPLHGERGSLDYWQPETLQTRFWEVIVQGVQEACLIADELSHEDEDGSPTAIVGHSAGGFIAAGAYAKHRNFHSAAVINGSCAWARFEALYRESINFPPMEPNEIAVMAEHDPMEHLLARPDLSLLLLHCETDSFVPIGSQQFFVGELNARGISPEAFQFHTFARVDHVITLGMLQRIHAFLTGDDA